jgi:choline dehydrogenase-like flavoprotein
MLHDVDTPARAAFGRPFDACVIGAGPAGITLARRLAGHGLSVALMEAGGLEASQASQELARGESVGAPFPELDVARLRYLGGCSGHWNGFCRAFDAADFAPRPASPGSGWPIGRGDLDPYAGDVAEILDLVPHDDGFTGAPEQDLGAFRRIHYVSSPPTRFGDKYRAELAASGRIAVGLNANLVDLRLDAAGTRVAAAVFKGYAAGDPGFAVAARAYALCTGGIENARLLLNFTGRMPAGIGNAHDLVGRYFSDHTRTPEPLGAVILARPHGSYNQFFAPTEAFMAAHGGLPMLLRIYSRPRPPLPFGKELARSVQCALPLADRLAEAVLGDSLRCNVGGGLADWWLSRDPVKHPWGRVVVNAEAALDRDSRVTLAEETDRFGLRRARLDWRLSPVDEEIFRTTTLAFGGWLAERNLGRLRIHAYWTRPDAFAAAGRDESLSSYHHMCTTRMSDDPRSGVVDRHCRVHGMANLYVGGSSVFASPGFVNPTYTIVQLALRLGDRMAERGPAAPL